MFDAVSKGALPGTPEAFVLELKDKFLSGDAERVITCFCFQIFPHTADEMERRLALAADYGEPLNV